ncbi:Histidine--tRNA ligase [uncultured archaeon]|nr:Histidine--tRNA ligase [uncultured archaeon]
MVNTTKVKGFEDFLGEDAKKREKMMDVIRNQFKLFGFEPAETPIIESEEFVRGDNEKDSAVRDIFKLQDRGERKLALRFEFTFQLKRIAKNQKLPYKRYQIGYNFRDEPIREGRLRQFIQCDADIIGSSIKDEAELLALAKNVFDDLKISSKIYINNRKLINEILETEKIPERDRDQIIRELDKLDKLSKEEVAKNLKEFKAEKLLEIFTGKEKSFEKYAYFKEIQKLKDLARAYGVEVEFRPFLARGLSYYNGSVFEIWAKELGVSLSGGGSFLIDGIQSTGISFGLEPLFLISKIDNSNKDVLVLSISQDEKAVALANKLREKSVPVVLLMDKSPSKALDYANSKKIENVIIIGEEEVKSKKYTIKNMKSGKEEKLAEKEILEKFS